VTLRAGRLIGSTLAAGLLAACGSSPEAPTPAPPRATTRDGRFVQDIEALATDLPRLHANLFFQLNRADFDREVEALKARVPELRDHEVVTGLLRIAALPGDAHTAISPSGYPLFRRLPMRLRFLADGLTVTAAGPGAERLLGGRLVRIGALDAAAVVDRLAPVVSHENAAWLRAQVPAYLTYPEILHAQRVIADPELTPVTVLAPDGSTVQADLEARVAGQEGPLQDATEAGHLPLYRQRPQENYWYTWAEPDVLFLQYNRCQDAPADPMSSFARRVFDEIDRRPPRAFVVDLRANGGGNSAVIDPLLQGLRSRRYLADSGRLFALIGNNTFSSAMMNALTLRQENGAILVGEPTGGKPNGYGEVRTFTLPNTALTVSYSTRFFRLLTDSDPDSVFPQVEAGVSSADYRAGRDPALEAIAARLGLPPR
jgi:hypothetical protein